MTRSGTDNEPIDGEFVQAVEHVMSLHKEWKKEKKDEKNKANEENQKREYKTEVIREAATKRIKKNKRNSSSGTDTDEPKSDSDLKSSAVKLQSTMQDFLKAEMENCSVYKDQIAAFHEVEKEAMKFRAEKAMLEDERHRRDMEDRDKERECREKDRQMMMMLIQKQSEMMELFAKKMDEDKNKK
jgi:hypothetical protein